MSGGGTVFHDLGNLNFCFISIKKTGESALGSEFLQPIIWALNELFVETKIGKRKDIWLPDEHKISGTASHVGKTRELHHGTLLYDSDLSNLQNALSAKPLEHKTKAIASVPSEVKNIRIWLQEKYQNTLAANHFFELLKLKLQQFYCVENTLHFAENEISEINKIKQTKYDSMDWVMKK
jgi:lipoate-protein ligase A